MSTAPELKACIHCGQEKAENDFPPSQCHTSGRDNRCRTCRAAITRDYKRRKKLGLAKTRQRIKKPADVHVEPFDPELETRRRINNLVQRYGIDGARAKIKLEAFAT